MRSTRPSDATPTSEPRVRHLGIDVASRARASRGGTARRRAHASQRGVRRVRGVGGARDSKQKASNRREADHRARRATPLRLDVSRVARDGAAGARVRERGGGERTVPRRVGAKGNGASVQTLARGGAKTPRRRQEGGAVRAAHDPQRGGERVHRVGGAGGGEA